MRPLSDPAERDRRRRRAARVDLAFVALFVLIGFVLAGVFQLFEGFAHWSAQHEELEADELVVAAVASIFGMAIYSLRRYRDARTEARELIAAERELAITNQRYRSLFEYHPDGVFSLMLDGRFDSANRAAQELCGYTEEELTRISFVELLPADELAPVAEAFTQVLARRPQHVETCIAHKDGHLVEVSVTGLPIVVGDDVTGVFGIAEDVTLRNRLQRELEHARRAAEEANQAKSLFLANMSHEIRTPLTSVIAAGELLRDTDLGHVQNRLTEVMRRSGERLLRLVDEILDFSRIEAGRVVVETVEFDPHEVLEEVLTHARVTSRRKGLALESAVDAAVPHRAVGDPVRLAQVLANLLDNAVKFTDAGSVRLTARITGEDLLLAIEDTGIGMTPDEADQVFEPFRQADPSITRRYGGTGLGLAICRQLVGLMQGSLELRSAPGAGTTFVVRLPLVVSRA